jgi:hypothetical protein
MPAPSPVDPATQFVIDIRSYAHYLLPAGCTATRAIPRLVTVVVGRGDERPLPCRFDTGSDSPLVLGRPEATRYGLDWDTLTDESTTSGVGGDVVCRFGRLAVRFARIPRVYDLSVCVIDRPLPQALLGLGAVYPHFTFARADGDDRIVCTLSARPGGRPG